MSDSLSPQALAAAELAFHDAMEAGGPMLGPHGALELAIIAAFEKSLMRAGEYRVGHDFDPVVGAATKEQADQVEVIRSWHHDRVKNHRCFAAEDSVACCVDGLLEEMPGEIDDSVEKLVTAVEEAASPYNASNGQGWMENLLRDALMAYHGWVEETLDAYFRSKGGS